MPRKTTQLNKPNNQSHRASLALKCVLVIAGNDMRVP